MPHIIPIKDLKNTSEISELCRKVNEPIYITKNGYGDMVIMNMEVYENLVNLQKTYKEIEISEKDIKEGKVKDANESLKNMREKYGL